MVLSLIKGQKMDLTKNNPDLKLIHIGLDWEASSLFDIDVSAFMLGQDEKIVSEEDFVFYGQPISSNGSVRLEESISTIEKQHFMIDLLEVPSGVNKIAFTLTIYESELNGHTFEEVPSVQLRIVNSRSQEEVATYQINYAFTKESAIVLGEIYRYAGEWKFQAVGAGFFGGLADLCHEYGVEVDNEQIEQTQSQVEVNLNVSANQRFQVVQERNDTVVGEEIPPLPADSIHLKRTPFVQFNENRIAALSQQSDDLIHLFEDQEEDHTKVSLVNNKVNSPTIPNFINEVASVGDLENFIDSLTNMEKTFLLYSENRQIPMEQAKAFLKQRGFMLAFFVDTINEKANEFLDDNLLELQAETIVVYEEFEPLMEKIKERTRYEH